MRRFKEKITGYLEVGQNPETGEVIINHPQMEVDENGAGYLTFSPNQARHLAALLIKHANDVEAASCEDCKFFASDDSICFDRCGKHREES